MEHLRDTEHGLFVVVEGNISSGKSTITAALAAYRDAKGPKRCRLFPEPIGEPAFRRLLGLYYQDPKRWGLTFQMFVLERRFRQHTFAAELVSNGTDVVQDRGIYADGVFGTLVRDAGNMTPDEWDIYARTFGALKRFLRYPDVLVYLRTTPEVCLERLKRRARSEEASVPLDYLQRLHENHERFVEEMARYTRVIRFDADATFIPVETIDSEIERVAREDVRFIRDWKRI